ncbi:transcriptional regulator domain-containing protein [Hyphomicrobium sp.]|uniref:transcriptional regulator domain-containing protein n=1 Tax=Hyphomicrobium sp. TaxID=82 RepID=UPI003FA53352
MRSPPTWKSPEYCRQFQRLDRAELTFEFLRRNAEYKSDYKRAIARITSTRADEEEVVARLAARWGLTFPGRSRTIRRLCPAALAAGLIRRYRHRWSRSAGLRRWPRA